MKRIAIVAGGDSGEYAVSLRSAQGVWSFLNHETYEPHIIVIRGQEWNHVAYDGTDYDFNRLSPVDRADFSVTLEGQKLTFDFAYIIIHGTPGENGLLQGYFDLLGMPYSCCGVLAAALTANKYVCNHYLSTFQIPCAKSLLLRRDDACPKAEEVVAELGLPLFVKPNCGGSSCATTKVKEAGRLAAAVAEAKTEGGEVIIESFMQGTEISCGCFRGAEGLVALPITEIVPANEFFDYDAKYNGQVEEITPARLSPEMTARVQELTRRIYGYLGAKGIIRVDYIIIDGTPHLLEVNTTPGMTATSFIPQQVRAAGLDISYVMDQVITVNS
jgi:D-alanine-D-alanine ligase